MQDIINELTSAHWWITVAVASLVLNILASYFVRGLDRFVPRLSARVRSWTGQKSAEFSQEIDRAARDLQFKTFLAARQASLHVAALHNYLLAAVAFYVAGKLKSPVFFSALLWLIGFLFTLAGSVAFGHAMRCKTILDGGEKFAKEYNKRAAAQGQPTGQS